MLRPVISEDRACVPNFVLMRCQWIDMYCNGAGTFLRELALLPKPKFTFPEIVKTERNA